jgi:hypothetical protein
MVDHSALRVNQSGIILTVLVAVLGSAVAWPLVWLVPALALVLLVGTVWPQAALFKQIYFRILQPAGLVKPRPVQESPAPHNFAQGLGGVFLLVATLLLPLAPVAGLALALLVAALAAVNLFLGFCLGCQIYFQLGRMGLVRA